MLEGKWTIEGWNFGGEEELSAKSSELWNARKCNQWLGAIIKLVEIGRSAYGQLERSSKSVLHM